MANPKPACHLFHDPIYNIEYMVAAAPDTKLEALIKRDCSPSFFNVLKNDNWFSEKCGGRCVFLESDGEKVIAIYINQDALKSYQRLIVVHEALHATFSVLAHVGMPHSAASEEAYTYYQGWLVGELWERLGL